MSGKRWPLTLLVAAYLALAVMYSAVTPLFESPDEVWHYEYIRWLAAGKGLAAPEDVGVAPWAQEGSQPPLYYLLGAAVTAFIPTDNADAVIRYNAHPRLATPMRWATRTSCCTGAPTPGRGKV
jgi:hypothetical protein